MQAPVQFTLRNIKHSSAIEAHIMEKAGKLAKFSERIISCHVVAEMEHTRSGDLYNVRINVLMPNKKELSSTHNQKENLYLSIADAFDDMLRQVEETSRRMQGHVKHHDDILHGEIARLFPVDQFGFIETSDGDEYYFNSGSLHHPHFDHLKVGMPVRFIAAWDADGPRAHRVSAKEKE